MTIHNPYLLPKIRSEELMSSVKGMPCALRVASFVGQSCAPMDTVVGCHVGNIGKGVATKVSDLCVVAGCRVCHDLIDKRDSRFQFMMEKYPAAVWERIALAMMETQARWIMGGQLIVPDGRIV